MNERTKKLPLVFMVLAIFTVLFAVLYFKLPIALEKMNREEAKIQEAKIYHQIETYYTPLPVEANMLVPHDWTDVVSDGKTMYATINNTRVWARCSDQITLKENAADKYITQAPLGELIVQKGIWYIANISKSFTDKDHVIKHIQSCSNELGKHYQEKIALEQKNRKSFDM